MRKDCSTCKQDYMETEYPLREPCNTCIASSRGGAPSRWEASEHYRPDTNADRIRDMTDEELANLINCEFYSQCEWCNGDKPIEVCMSGDCIACIVEWLRQPVKEE